MTIPIRLSTNPALIIIGILNKPEPKTIAFGGVATGSIKAQLAAKVTGAANIIGLMPISIAIAPITGRNVAVVATLLVSSVKKIIITAIIITIRVVGRVLINERLEPNQAANPELLTAAARDKPPPKSNNTPQGNFSRCIQRRRMGSSLSPLGTINSEIAPAIAILESSSALKPGIVINNGLVFQAIANNKNIIRN